MQHEIELKLKIDDPAAVRERLRAAGAEPAGSEFEVNRIFDSRDRRLFSADSALRVRQIAGEEAEPRVLVTFKGPRTGAEIRSREEIETEVADAAGIASVFERLGYVEVIRYEKRREVWRLDECEVLVDELPRLGWFVELEAAKADVITRSRELLGLLNAPALIETYVALAAEHGRQTEAGIAALEF